MLPRAHRLVKDKDIERLFAKGRRVSCSFCGVRVLPNKLAETRVAVIAPGKLSGQAVIRNRAKRRAREALRPLLPLLKSGHDMALVLFPASLTVPLPEMTRTLRSLFEKTRLL
ncbi:ribonuclease P protein component [Candidatus Uhrbacteria bacterium]|nr:ribonuclease P protein component [Candidatus Uhrbacteria bacterium]